jgi:hypothetical protein
MPLSFADAQITQLKMVASMLHWHHFERRGSRICRDTHRPLPYAYSPLPDPGHQRFGQPGAKHRSGAVCWRSVRRAALAVLVAPTLGAAIAGLISRWQYEAPDMSA